MPARYCCAVLLRGLGPAGAHPSRNGARSAGSRRGPSPPGPLSRTPPSGTLDCLPRTGEGEAIRHEAGRPAPRGGRRTASDMTQSAERRAHDARRTTCLLTRVPDCHSGGARDGTRSCRKPRARPGNFGRVCSCSATRARAPPPRSQLRPRPSPWHPPGPRPEKPAPSRHVAGPALAIPNATNGIRSGGRGEGGAGRGA